MAARPQKADQPHVSIPESTKGVTSVVYGGVAQKKLETCFGSIENLKAKVDKLRGDASADWKIFEEAGGDKKALKWAMSLDAMPAEQKRPFLINFLEYVIGLGIEEDSQLDLFGSDVSILAMLNAKFGENAAPSATAPVGPIEATMAHEASIQ